MVVALVTTSLRSADSDEKAPDGVGAASAATQSAPTAVALRREARS